MPLHVTRIRAICFDVDGTLSDTDDVMVERLGRLIRYFDFLSPGKNIEKLARRIVMGIETPANFLIGLPDVLGFDNQIFALVDKLARHTGRQTRDFKIIPGVKEMLAVLSRQYPLAVVSARDERTTRSFLDEFDLMQYFRCIATALTCEHTKPFPDPILWAAQQMDVPTQACLMVGDTTVDMRAAGAAQAQKVGVLCGFGEISELQKSGADLVLDSTPELVDVLDT